MSDAVGPRVVSATTTNDEAEALSKALVALGAPAEPVAAVEWMFAYPSAHPLLHLLSSSFGPSCVLSETEIAARATLPSPDGHVIARALPTVRGVRRPSVSREEAAQTRLNLLRAQRDALLPLVRAREEAAEEAFAATLHGSSSDDAGASSARTAATRARMARIRLSSLLPLPTTGSVSRCARSVADAERRALASALIVAKTVREKGRNAGDDDRRAAEDAVRKFTPLFAAAAARRARRRGRSEQECEKEAEAASKEATDIVTLEIAARTKRRQRVAVDVTANAVEKASEQRVRLEVLLRALRVKREVHSMLNDYLRAATAAKPADWSDEDTAKDVVRKEEDEIRKRIEEIFETSEKQLAELYGYEATAESNMATNELQAKIDELAEPVKELLVQSAAHAALASTESAVVALNGVQRVVAQNGAALETLMRERKSRLARSSQSGTPAGGSFADNEDMMQSAEYAALVEYHVGNRHGIGTDTFSNTSAIDTSSSRSIRSGRTERSAASSATGYGAG